MPNNEQLKLLKEIRESLKELVAFARVQNSHHVKELLQHMNRQERQAYEMSDGTKTQAEIAKALSVTQQNISYYWKKWFILGLTSESTDHAGRQRRNFSLSDFGISKSGVLPKTEKPESQLPEEQTENT